MTYRLESEASLVNPRWAEVGSKAHNDSKRKYIRCFADANSGMCFRTPPHDVTNLCAGDGLALRYFGCVVPVRHIHPCNFHLVGWADRVHK